MRRRAGRLLVVAVAAALAAAAAAASELSDDLASRRNRVMERLGPETLLLLWSAPEQRYSGDVNYEYRQDNDLYYLTGITQPDTRLVLMPGNPTRREVLFVEKRNPAQEHWSGRLMSIEEAKMRTGIDTVLTTDEFDGFVAAMLGGRDYRPVGTGAFAEALEAGRARVGVVLDDDRKVDDPPPAPLEYVRKLRDRFPGFDVLNAARIFNDLRLVKTPYERRMLVRSADISVAGQLAGMRTAHPGAFEYEVKAAVEAVHRARGAVSWAYPSIVGSGPNATILHYPDGDRQMQSGELLLVDAACNYGYMGADITRTYPVNGTFSAAQRDLYQIVLQAQQAGIKAARPGATLQDIHDATVEVIKAGLLRLGLITDANSEQYRLWYTHGASHFIGMDVHDVGTRTTTLAPGMAFTIEPGLYIRQSALDTLPATAESRAFIDRVTPAVRKYTDLGIRIEDSFLLDDAGLRNLSSALPKTIEDVEAVMKGKK
jgi:Xaa-Pro aminopeptidase